MAKELYGQVQLYRHTFKHSLMASPKCAERGSDLAMRSRPQSQAVRPIGAASQFEKIPSTQCGTSHFAYDLALLAESMYGHKGKS